MRSISHKIWILAGVIVPNENNAKAKNIAVLFNPNGKQVGAYQKMYPFTRMGEEKVHTRGKSMKTFHVEGFQLSPILCYDLRFPELFRMNIVQGTNLFVVIASWPKVRINHWHTLLQARAIENECFVAIAGCVGNLPKVHNMDIQYAQSMVFTPCDFAFPANGIKAEATTNTEMILIADVDLDLLKDLNQFGSVRNLKDRRTDLFELKKIKK